MVHDLTAKNDFSKEINLSEQLHKYMEKAKEEKDELTPPDKEIILTGTTNDREVKRYVLDCENNQRNICDCCGRSINNKPWNFIKQRTLCSYCELRLEREYGAAVEIRKPWDIVTPEREEIINNVFLWD